MSTVLNNVKDYVAIASQLGEEFAKDAVERDKLGGTPTEQLAKLKESGLLNLFIPKEYGGDGQPWSVVLRIVRELAKVDAAIAHLYGFHVINIASPHYRGTSAQKAFYYEETVKNNWFWGNAVNTKDRNLHGKLEGNHYIVNGIKPFASGSPGSDHLIIAWRDENLELVYAAIPPSRKGVTVNEDWDGIGQRQTGSGTVLFENVVVEKHEVLNTTSFGMDPLFLTQLLSVSVLANVFIGSSLGAIEEAKKYVINKFAKVTPEGEKPIYDSFILRQLGDFVIKTKSIVTLGEEALVKLDRAWEKEFYLTEEELSDLAASVISSNVASGEVALQVTNEIFEVMGARSATTKNGFDRFWRNVRTHTLHDSVDLKRSNVGKWLLTNEFPKPKA